MKILPSLTTITESRKVGDWRAQISEIKKLGLTEFALFPTKLLKEERFELYAALKEIPSLERIPFVHLRTDMEPEEIGYLIENFQTEVFNLHTTVNWPLQYDYSKYAKQIFIENGKFVPTEADLSTFGGMCIDFSHWESMVKFGNKDYDEQMLKMAEKYPIGVCHISAITTEATADPSNPGYMQYDSHRLEHLQELDYMKNYLQYVPTIVAIELENSIEKQLEAKEYLEAMLG